jgi:hypothetical protein
MIGTDSYLNYADSDFSTKNHQPNKYYNATANKPPLPSGGYSLNSEHQQQQQQMNGDVNKKRIYTEETIIEILKGR